MGSWGRRSRTVTGPEGAAAKVVVYIKLTHKPKN